MFAVCMCEIVAAMLSISKKEPDVIFHKSSIFVGPYVGTKVASLKKKKVKKIQHSKKCYRNYVDHTTIDSIKKKWR